MWVIVIIIALAPGLSSRGVVSNPALGEQGVYGYESLEDCDRAKVALYEQLEGRSPIRGSLQCRKVPTPGVTPKPSAVKPRLEV